LQKVFDNKGILIRSADVRVQQLPGATATAATMTATRTTSSNVLPAMAAQQG
jgi:hypothetical protein